MDKTVNKVDVSMVVDHIEFEIEDVTPEILCDDTVVKPVMSSTKSHSG